VLLLDHTASATIESGASINQATSFVVNGQTVSLRTGSQQVAVTANAVSEMINITGNFNTPGLNLDTNTSWAPSFNTNLYGTKDGGKAIGGGAMVQFNVSNVTADIADGVHLYGDSLDVEADTTNIAINLVASGGKSSSFGLNATMVFDSTIDTTLAQIGSGAFVTIGSGHVGGSTSPAVLVSAEDSTFVVSVAGSFVASDATAVGLSGAVNLVGRSTQAVIGATEDGSAASTLGFFTSGGNVDVDATNGGFIGAFAIAGTKSSGSSTQSKDGEGGTNNPGTGGTQGSNGTAQSNQDLSDWQSKQGSLLQEMVTKRPMVNSEVASTTKEVTGSTTTTGTTTTRCTTTTTSTATSMRRSTSMRTNTGTMRRFGGCCGERAWTPRRRSWRRRSSKGSRWPRRRCTG